MKKHSIEASQNIKQEDLRQLPDRTELTKLYPNPNDITARTKNNWIPKKTSTSIASLHFSILAGSILLLPFILAGILFNLFTQSIRASNIFFLLPLIVLSLLLVIILLVLVYNKISKRILGMGYDPLIIFALHAGCLMCFVLPLYLLFSKVPLLYLVAMVSISVILLWIFLRIATSKQKDKTKNIAVLVISGVSLLISVSYLMVK